MLPFLESMKESIGETCSYVKSPICPKLFRPGVKKIERSDKGQSEQFHRNDGMAAQNARASRWHALSDVTATRTEAENTFCHCYRQRDRTALELLLIR